MENKTISEQIAKIIQLCYQINSVETNQEETGNLPTVLVDFHGHTCQLDARIYEEGWGAEVNPDYTAVIYLDYSDASEKLNVLIERLSVTLKLKARKEEKSEMCDYCGTYPHHNMCPNAEPPEEVTCCKCGNNFYVNETDEFIEFKSGDIVCNDCLRDYCKENFT